MKPLKVILISTFLFAVLANRITKLFEFEKWHVSLALLILGAILYLVNVFLIQYFIKSKTPELANEYWEVTAGTGIVPKWVSLIGLLSISAVITAVLPWIIKPISNLI